MVNCKRCLVVGSVAFGVVAAVVSVFLIKKKRISSKVTNGGDLSVSTPATETLA